MDAELIAAQMRRAVFPDLWSACSTWASGLLSWHTCARMELWSPTEAYLDEFGAWVQALVACALHQASEPEAPTVLFTPLAGAAQLLSDVPAVVTTVDSLPEAPPGELAAYLASVVGQLEHGNVEIKERIVHIVGLAYQVLADHAAAGATVDDRLSALARAAHMTMALTDDTHVHPAYPDAPPLSQHLAQVRQLREAHDLAELSGQRLTSADRREMLVQSAAFADRWLLAWGPEDQPAERVEHAEHLASALLRHDQEHASPQEKQRGDGAPSPAAYVRDQYARSLPPEAD
ncbi:hypothetical protein [Streptomyces sp. NPDC058268]|uniref:hypothetical protein n=1 Tax=Streptomyces sp. NPDC058268 TaxID=3346413 RepID=UPI0036E9E1A9